MSEHRQRFADDFVRRIAVEPFRRFVPSGDRSVQIYGQHRIFRRLDNRGEIKFRFFRPFAFGDVDKIQNHAVNAVVECSIRREAGEIIQPVLVGDFVFDGREFSQNPFGIACQIVVNQFVRKMRERSPDVGFGDAEKIFDQRRVAFDLQILVEKNRGDVGRRHQILYIRIGANRFINFVFEFVIDGGQFLVDRLQFFLARFQFFRSRTQFFIDRLHFFVRGFEFLNGNFVLFDGRAQL